MITGHLQKLDHPSRVFVSRASRAGAGSGLATDSVIVTDNLATIREPLIRKRIGHLADMSAVDAALRHTLAL